MFVDRLFHGIGLKARNSWYFWSNPSAFLSTAANAASHTRYGVNQAVKKSPKEIEAVDQTILVSKKNVPQSPFKIRFLLVLVCIPPPCLYPVLESLSDSQRLGSRCIGSAEIFTETSQRRHRSDSQCMYI